MIYGIDYFGFVYVWYNRTALDMEKPDLKNRHGNRTNKRHPRLYIGAHYGPYTDGYVCSSRWMKSAYKNCPSSFMRHIVYWQRTPDRQSLKEMEKKWLDLILPEECGTRFYNLRRNAEGTGAKTPYWKKKVSASLKDHYADPANREIVRQNSLKMWDDPYHQEKIAEASKQSWADPEVRKTRTEGIQKARRTKAQRDHQGQLAAARWANTEYKTATSESLKQTWTPQYRDTMSGIRKAQWMEHRDIIVAKRKGTAAKGERHSQAKLTREQVQVIKDAPGTQKQIAVQFGISQAQVSNIKNGKSW